MEKFYLERPSMDRKEELIDYFNEHVKFNSNINGSGSLEKVIKGYSFEDALKACLNMENADYAKSINKCPGKTFLLIRENDNKIIGTINIRWNLNDYMKRIGGNIGYGIRPTERRKGYNKINLYLGMIEAQKMGLDKVMISCSTDNIGSDKTLKALGGILERTEVDSSDESLTNIYNFDVNECIEAFRNIYERFVKATDIIKKY